MPYTNRICKAYHYGKLSSIEPEKERKPMNLSAKPEYRRRGCRGWVVASQAGNLRVGAQIPAHSGNL